VVVLLLLLLLVVLLVLLIGHAVVLGVREPGGGKELSASIQHLGNTCQYLTAAPVLPIGYPAAAVGLLLLHWFLVLL